MEDGILPSPLPPQTVDRTTTTAVAITRIRSLAGLLTAPPPPTRTLDNGGDGWDYEDGYWTTSFEWCRRSVLVNLTRHFNLTADELDHNMTSLTATELVRYKNG